MLERGFQTVGGLCVKKHYLAEFIKRTAAAVEVFWQITKE